MSFPPFILLHFCQAYITAHGLFMLFIGCIFALQKAIFTRYLARHVIKVYICVRSLEVLKLHMTYGM